MLRMHKAHQHTNLIHIACAALAGSIAGTLVGLMLAPKSGKELRRGIYKKADDVIEQVEDAVEDTMDHVEEVTSHHAGAIKKQGTNLVGKGKKLADDLQTSIQESLMPKK